MNSQILVGGVIAAVLGTGAAAVVTNVELLNAPSGTSIERASDVLVTEIVEPDNLPYPPTNEVAPTPALPAEETTPEETEPVTEPVAPPQESPAPPAESPSAPSSPPPSSGDDSDGEEDDDDDHDDEHDDDHDDEHDDDDD